MKGVLFDSFSSSLSPANDSSLVKELAVANKKASPCRAQADPGLRRSLFSLGYLSTSQGPSSHFLYIEYIYVPSRLLDKKTHTRIYQCGWMYRCVLRLFQAQWCCCYLWISVCFIALRSVHKCSCCMIGPLSSAPGAFLQGRPQIQEKQEEDEKEEEEEEEGVKPAPAGPAVSHTLASAAAILQLACRRV